LISWAKIYFYPKFIGNQTNEVFKITFEAFGSFWSCDGEVLEQIKYKEKRPSKEIFVANGKLRKAKK
jgi:hypothetical protein